MTLTNEQTKEIISRVSSAWDRLGEIPEKTMTQHELYHLNGSDTISNLEKVCNAISDLVFGCDNLMQVSAMSNFIIRNLKERNNLRTMQNMEILE